MKDENRNPNLEARPGGWAAKGAGRHFHFAPISRRISSSFAESWISAGRLFSQIAFRLSVFAVCLLAGPAVFGATINVEIRSFYFIPTNILIQPGDTVVWKNTAFQPHDTTHRPISGPRLWASPVLSQNDTFSFTFTQPGDYPYVCAIHVANFPQQTGLVTVASINLPPTVRITNPASGALLAEPATFTVSAEASDSDGSVSTVEFFLNGTSIGVSSGPAFTAAINGLAAGSYSLTAVATDNSGATTTSSAVSFTVQPQPTRYALSVSAVPTNGGAVTIDPPQPTEGYVAGTVVSLSAMPANGFAFSGWSGSVTGAQNPLTVTMDGAKSITATFSVIATPTFALTILTNPPGSGIVTASPAPNAAGGTYLQGTSVSLTAAPAVNFAFSNWSGDASGSNNPVTIIMDADKTVGGNFVEHITPSYALALVTNPPGAGTIQASPPPNAADGRYLEGTLVTLTAAAIGTNTFTSWSGYTNSAAASIAVRITADISLTASFVPVLPVFYRLTVSASPTNGGTIAVTPPSTEGTYPAGTILAVAANPNAGFRFVRWSGDVVSTNTPIPLTMDRSKVLTAEFEPVTPANFALLAGSYAGLLLDNGSTNYTTTGFLSLRLAKSGFFRGSAIIGGMREAIKGQFDRFGYAPLVVRKGSLSGSLQLVSSNAIAGLLTDFQNPDVAAQSAPIVRLYRTAPSTNTAILAGTYSLRVEAPSQDIHLGEMSLEILPNAVARIRGRLGDQAPIAQKTFVSIDGSVPLFVRLYHGRGVIAGWLDVATEGGVSGNLLWYRPPDSRSPDYPAGFALRVAVSGNRSQ